MLTFRVRDHVDADLVAGATRGEDHLRQVLGLLPIDPLAESTVIIDFDGISGATGSYLRAFVAGLLRGRQVALEMKDPSAEAQRYDIFVANVSEDVALDMRGMLIDAKLTCLEALKWDAARVRVARCHGALDPAVAMALRVLLDVGAATAAQLTEKTARKERIGTTAWHYRLGELLRLGLARRTKAERSWIYEPAAVEVLNG